MRGLLALLLVPAVVGAAAAEAGDDPLPGLHIRLRKPIVHRGGTVRAGVAWEVGDGGAAGTFTVRWQLRAADGAVVAHGRRPWRIGWNEEPPYRFHLAARAPRDMRYGALRLEVGLVDDPSRDGGAWSIARGEATVSIGPAHAPWVGRGERETWTGTLADAGDRTELRYSDPSWYSLGLEGPGESDIRSNPAWVGARVTLVGRRRPTSFIPEDPGTLWVEEVEWLDPLPASVPLRATARGVVPARLPPPEVIGEVNWARFARESRAPLVLETAGELAALHADLGTADEGPYDPFPFLEETTDFGTHRVVVLFAGVSPDPSWTVVFDSAVFDPAGGRTLVDYSVVAPADGFTRGFRWSEPFMAVALERRDGPVAFRRHEWIPEPPPWW